MQISFIIATLNESLRIEKCLSAIRSQNYNQELVEIIVCDGGSEDNTVELAEKYGCVILRNKLRTAETGMQLGASASRGALVTALAADNYLVGNNWISDIVNAFNSLPEIMAIFPQVVVDPTDNSFSQYYTKMYCDPFNKFVFGDAANPNNFKNIYKLLLDKNNILVYDMKKQPPLIALAQAFTYRSSWLRPPSSLHDDIIPVWSLIESNQLLAYYPNLHIYHNSFNGFLHFVKKFFYRSSNALQHGFKSRAASLPWAYKARILLWFLYSGTIIGPVVHSVKWAFKDREISWLWHGPACVALTGSILFGALRSLFISNYIFILYNNR